MAVNACNHAPVTRFDRDRFGGIARLYGDAAAGTFAAARVAVIGIGGVGSWAAESLARSGIGHITLVDMDEVCITNTNRQIHALDGTVGQLKTSVMAERIRKIHPGCEVDEVPRFFHAASAGEILHGGFDAVIDAIDDTRNKCLLLAECRRMGCVTVTCGGAGGRRDPGRVRVADLAYSGKDGLLHQVRKRLRQQHGFAPVPMGSRPEPMGIDAVFSDEPQVFIQCDGEVSAVRPEGEVGRLNCAGGLGAATHVTAVFGLVAAGQVLLRLAEPSESCTGC